MPLGVRDGRAVAAGLARARGSVLARRRAGAPRAGARGSLASGAGSAASPCRGLAVAPGAARWWSARTLPALRSGVPPGTQPAPAVLGVAHSARPVGRWLALGRRQLRQVNRRAMPSEVDAMFVQPDDRVDLLSGRVPHLEMQMRPGRVAPVAHLGDLLVRSNLLACYHERAVDVPVDGNRSIGVSDAYPEPESARRPGLHDHAVGGGDDRRPDGVGEVDTVMERSPPAAESRREDPLRRQDELGRLASACRAVCSSTRR